MRSLAWREQGFLAETVAGGAKGNGHLGHVDVDYAPTKGIGIKQRALEEINGKIRRI